MEQVNIIKNWVWVGAGCLRCWTHIGVGPRQTGGGARPRLVMIRSRTSMGPPGRFGRLGWLGRGEILFLLGFIPRLSPQCRLSRLDGAVRVCARTVGSELVMSWS